jgi:outer membrane protein OmpA-like peptidoglycan-associated protein/tetratricopeptide (TPR) repeat protein
MVMRTRLLFLLFILSGSAVFAQKKLADKFYDNFGYAKAIELYEEVVEKGDSSVYVLSRLGDCYYNNANSEKAAFWYGEALKKDKKIDAEYLYKYIQSLRSIGEYEQANSWLAEFKAMQEGDSRVKGYDPDQVDYYSDLTAPSDMVVAIKNEDFNSKYSDFGAYVADGKIYFASARNINNKIYKWTNEPFLDLYVGNVENDSISEVDLVNFERRQKANAHIGTLCITNDGSTMYFTMDNVSRGNKLDFDKDGTSHLKLYKASLIEGQWSDIEELPFNDDNYSNGNPALSPDNKTLLFVSDREGGYGQTDLYKVAINSDGSFGEPENLGPAVNTEGREMFPFVSKDNTLYFSSDGYLNLGLLDIFSSFVLTGDQSEPVNLGAPYNSGYDDFAYMVDSDTQKGYFASNRPGGQGNDDIYSFSAYPCKELIQGTVRDLQTNIAIPMATVRLIDKTGKVVEQTTTDTNGQYSIEADCGQSFVVIGSKVDYREDQKSVTTTSDNLKSTIVDLDLEPLIVENQIVLNPIFFDFDKANIRTDAQYELENIVDVMRNNPTMIIKIESHTDSRGSDRYNMKLSDRRAKATQEYILTRGIDPNRIESAIGYGETQLLNKCSNGVKCSKEEHQLNRRSYFYIVKN